MSDTITGIGYGITILLFLLVCYLFEEHLKNVKKKHKEELSVAKHESFNHGWNEAVFSLPVVQHCNSRTDYEFIKHRWNPQHCIHCAEVQDLLNER